MKIPIKFGLLITLGVMAWVLIVHSVITNPQSLVHRLGVSISFVYALTVSLFFAGVLAVVGTKWLASEPGIANMPTSRVAAQAFIGLFLGSLLFGLIYSTVISFFLAKRISGEEA